MRRHLWIGLLASCQAMAAAPTWAQQVETGSGIPAPPTAPRRPNNIPPKTFDPNAISDLLNKNPRPAASYQLPKVDQVLVVNLTIRDPLPQGMATGSLMTGQGLKEAQSRFLDCWDIPVNMLPDMGSYFAEVHALLNEDSNVTGTPSVLTVSGPTPSDADAFKRLAVDAVFSCANTLKLPSLASSQFKNVIFRFDLLGTKLNEPARAFSAQSRTAPLNQQELDELRKKINSSWRSPEEFKETIIVGIKLSIDGILSSPPAILTKGSGKDFIAARDSIVRSIIEAQPFDMLPPEKYASWKDIEMAFNPIDWSHLPEASKSAPQDEMNAVLKRILANWNTLDASGKKLDYPDIDISIKLDKDGNVESTPTLRGKMPDHPLAQQAFQRAIAAIYKSAPFDTLPKDKYDSWKVFDVTFSLKDKSK